jgi:hypothetical protein
MTRPHPLLLALLTIPMLACEPEAAKDKAKEVAEEAKEKAKVAAEEAKELGEQAKEAGAKAKDKATELADAAVDKSKEAIAEGKEMWAERKGELSDEAKELLAKGAAAKADSVEALLHDGKQVAPVALEVAKTLHGAVDTDTDIEPIVQNLEDEDAQKELDKRIADMPRVETIEGVQVGFKEVTQWDTTGRETQSAYLILWRRENRLLGLVYRSNNRINLDELVKEAPRLIKLAQGVSG